MLLQTDDSTKRKKKDKQTHRDRETETETESKAKTRKEELDSSSIDSVNVLTGGAPIDLPLTFLRHA
jgi:hypothetical protein